MTKHRVVFDDVEQLMELSVEVHFVRHCAVALEPLQRPTGNEQMPQRSDAVIGDPNEDHG